jgi:hypothetical protein
MNKSASISRKMKVSNAAPLIDKSERWLKDLIKSGTVVGHLIGGEVAVDVESLNDYLEKTRLGPRIENTKEKRN